MPHNVYSDTPSTIKAMRKVLKMTQSEFSECFHIPKRTIQDWESGKHLPPKYVIDLLYEVYLTYCQKNASQLDL